MKILQISGLIVVLRTMSFLEQGYWGWMLLWPILGAFMIVLGEEKWIKK